MLATFGRKLNLDILNFEYFTALYDKYKVTDHLQKIHIGRDRELIANCFYPYPILPKSERSLLPVMNYSDLPSSKSAEGAAVWIKKMQAGTGSTIERTKYLSSEANGRTKLGSKGTDLFTSLHGHKVSIAELQILQAISFFERKEFGAVIYQDIVSPDTENEIAESWDKRSPVHQGKTYREIFSQNPNLQMFPKIVQRHLPTVDEWGELTLDRTAPGGHGLFGVDAILSALDDHLRPPSPRRPLIGVIGNGEDLSSSPDGKIISWMIDEAIPLVMVTTTKTPIDMKGGQIGLVYQESGSYVTILERAQAESSGELKRFEEMGLRPLDEESLFNTNMVLINYTVLTPLLRELFANLSTKEILSLITPDLILNRKSQKNSSGEMRSYVQLEGALGSVMLNLDKYYRKKMKRPLISFLNIPTMERTRFFSPIKTAFDFILQFSSDRFSLCTKEFRLIDHAKGELLEVNLKDDYYKEVAHTISAFENIKARELRSLKIEGKVHCPYAELVGDLTICSKKNECVTLSSKERPAKLQGDINL